MSEIVIYNADEGVQIDVKFENESVWLSLNQIAILFGRDKSVISRHLKNVFKSEELVKSQVVAKNATTALDSKSYLVEFYNLDAIISGEVKINDNALTALVLLVAQSNPNDKELITKLICNLIKNN